MFLTNIDKLNVKLRELVDNNKECKKATDDRVKGLIREIRDDIVDEIIKLLVSEDA